MAAAARLNFDGKVDHLPDKIGGPFSTALSGYTFQYTYSSGVFYRVSFDEEFAYFTLPQKMNGRSYGTIPYRCREVRPNLFFAHWLVPGRTGHVSLIFDLNAKTVDAAALMPGKFELFDRASLGVILKDGEGALYKEDPLSTELEDLISS